jgi:hypothetical protein
MTDAISTMGKRYSLPAQPAKTGHIIRSILSRFQRVLDKKRVLGWRR